MNSMPMHTVKSCHLGKLVEMYNESLMHHWSVACRHLVGEKRAIDKGSLIMMCLSKASDGSVGPSCLAQCNSLPAERLCAWEHKDFGVQAVVVDVVTHTFPGYVFCRVEGIEPLGCEFANPSCCVENCG